MKREYELLLDLCEYQKAEISRLRAQVQASVTHAMGDPTVESGGGTGEERP